MKKTLFILCALLLTSIGASAQSSWTAPGSTLTNGGSYYLYNTEAEQCMGQVSLQWGTEAGFSSTGLLVTLDSSGSAYTIKNGNSYVFFDGAYLYVDGSESKGNKTFTFTAASDGTYTIQAAWSTDANNYLGYEGNGSIEIKTTLTSSDSGIYWELVNESTGIDLHKALVILYNTLVHAESYGMTDDATYTTAGTVYQSGNATVDDVMDAVAALEVAMENYATVADPDDVTYAYITNPNFDTGDLSNWTSASFSYHADPHTNGEITISGYAENWIISTSHLSDSKISQTLASLPKGTYRLEADAIALNESNPSITVAGVYLYASSSKTSVYTHAGLPEHFTVSFEVAETGSVEIGFEVSSTDYANWVAVDNFRLYYLGETLPYSIGEPQCALDGKYVQPGGTVSITFPNCTTPNTGDSPTLSGNITVNGTAVTDASLSYSGTIATVTFTLPESIGYGETFTVTVPAGLISWSGQGVSSAEATFTLTTPAIADQEGVYLLNCHIDEFISRGFAWGTEADADQYGIPVNIIAGEDGLYTIQFVDNSLYLGFTAWAYTDCSGADIMHYTIEPYSADGLEGYRFKCEEASTTTVDCYLYVNESGDFLIANNGHTGYIDDDGPNYTDIAQTVWQILSMSERDEHKAAFVVSQNAAIAELVSAAGLDTYIASKVANDVTRLVVAPDFSALSEDETTGWVASNTNTSGNNATATASENGLEVYNGCEQIQQTITGLAEGVYKIDLKGLYRQASNTVCWPYKDYDLSIAYVKANDYEINLKPWGSEATLDGSTYTPDTKAAAYTACASGYANELYTYVGEDGELVITITNPGHVGSEWMYVRGLALTYYGDEVEDDSEYKTGDEVTVDGVLYAVASDNMFVNGGFNNGMIGWTAGGYTTDAFPADFNVQSSGGFNSNPYLTVASGGATSEKTPTQAIAVEKNKTYLFIGYTSGETPEGERYSALFEMSDATTEANHNEDNDDGSQTSYSNTIIQLEWGETGWTKTMEVFTATTDYVGMRMGWSNGSYDGFQLYEVEPVASEVEWTMTAAEWGTLILPFAADIPEVTAEGESATLTLYAGSALSLGDTDDDGNTALTLGEAAKSIAANTPYLVSGTEGTYTFTGNPEEAESLTSGMLTGTFVDMAYNDFTHDGTQYLLQNHEGDVAFYPVVEDESAAATLTPYHCYLTDSSGKGVRGFISFPDSGEATGIVAVDGAEAEGNGAIYDLSGRRVSKAVKGVYIQNGKKVLVK